MLLRNDVGFRGFKPSAVDEKLATVLNELQNTQNTVTNCDTSANTGLLSNHLSNSNLSMNNTNKMVFRS